MTFVDVADGFYMFGSFWQIDKADKRLKASSLRGIIAAFLLCLNLLSSLAMVYHMTSVVHVHSTTTGQIVHLQSNDAVPITGIHALPKDQHKDHSCQAVQNALSMSAFLVSFAENDGACDSCLPSDDIRAKKLDMVYLAHRLHRLAPKHSPPASA